jgi:glycerol kinase
MEDTLILAIDQGTTNTKAILVDAQGRVVSRAARATQITYPQPGWVEQDALELWATARQAIEECAQATTGKIIAVAVTNQRETTVAWERRSGKPLAPAVVWQCRRSTEFCRQLTERHLEPFVRERTGLTIDPMFSGGKMRWLLDHIPEGQTRAEAGEICLGTVDSWMLWNLTGGNVFACDYTNASRTQLFNLHTLDWDDEILALFNIPRAALPQPHPSQAIFGQSVQIGDLPARTPVAAMIGDSHAALYGHAGFQPGSIKATYGTGTSLMTPTSRPVISQHGLSATIAWGKANGEAAYALEGNIYVTGAVVQWLGQALGKSDAAQIEDLAKQVSSNEGVYFVPAFVGLGAPHWNAEARGLISGLTRGAGAAHLARAALESIAYQVRDVFDVMNMEAGSPLQTLLADGGGSRNDFLMQFQADITGRSVVRNLSADVSAIGAAYLAGLTAGVWSSEAEIQQLSRPQERFEPRMSAEEREKLYAGWQDAVRRALL